MDGVTAIWARMVGPEVPARRIGALSLTTAAPSSILPFFPPTPVEPPQHDAASSHFGLQRGRRLADCRSHREGDWWDILAAARKGGTSRVYGGTFSRSTPSIPWSWLRVAVRAEPDSWASTAARGWGLRRLLRGPGFSDSELKASRPSASSSARLLQAHQPPPAPKALRHLPPPAPCRPSRTTIPAALPAQRNRVVTAGPRGTGFCSIVTSVLDWFSSSPLGARVWAECRPSRGEEKEPDGGESQGCNADGYARRPG